MLSDKHIHATVPAMDLDRARGFYERTLGFAPKEEAPGGVIYESGDTWFLLYPSTGAGSAQHTVAGWTVDDIEAEVDSLKSKGVVFESYEMPDFDAATNIFSPGPIRSAWFKDTEGNLLGLVQFVAS
jgi:catechol 2,3-dioxygenase-like lactoylglutathione lyase family enzyme